MSQNICNICGANYEYRNGRWVCPACGAYKQEELSNEEVTLLYNAAQKLRLCDFDEAEKAYTDIIEKFPKNPNGYWERLLSRYGIKYEEDFDGKKIPTCYAASIESVLSDKDYLKAVELADDDTKEYYRKQAEYIERVRKEWVEKARREKPYDIFICYKDSDLSNGNERTNDSIVAQELYIHLTEQGYRVFFSRESLRGKVGEKYEPYIFNALSTAKVMVVYGSSAEYITSTWLKNEWSRYEKKIESGEKAQGSLIVAYDGFNPADLPKALSSKQCIDARSRNFFGDLDKSIKKLIKGEDEKKVETVSEPQKKKKRGPIIAAVAFVLTLIIGLSILLPSILGDNGLTVVTNNEYDATVSISNGELPKNTVFSVASITEGTKYEKISESVADLAEIFYAYDMELNNKGVALSPNGNVTVTLPLPSDIPADEAVVYYVSDSGGATMVASTVSQNYITFTTSHFSIYVIAQQKLARSTIIFHANSGNGAMANTVVLSDTTTTLPANSFDKKGYYFSGWASSENGEIVALDKGTYQVGHNSVYNLYALWSPNTNTIIFNANGGSGEMQNQTAKTGEEITLTENSFTKTGYVFSGWATSEDGQVLYNNESNYIMGEESSYTLYAVWLPNKNTVVFNANGGKGLMDSIKIESDTSQVLPQVTFTKDGYTFAGWSDSKDGEVKYLDKANFSMGTQTSVTLYAVWTAKENKLFFNANGGNGEMPSVTLKTDETYNLPANLFQKSGYTFGGWSTSQYGEIEYENLSSYTMGTDSSYTLYAVWIANTNTLNFNANGGDGNMDSQSITTGSTITLPNCTFSKTGYAFAGWATSENGEIAYINEDKYTMGTDSSYTLYALWARADYLIQYELNGGINHIDNPNGYTVESDTIIFQAPTKDGYTFVGWFSDADFNNEITSIPVGSTGNKKIYACWEANTNTLVFNANGGDGEMPEQTAKTDSTFNLPQCTLEKRGYSFEGWSTVLNGTVTYLDKSTYTMGTSSSVTLYAVWSAIPYSISYDTDGGTISGQITQYTVESETFTLVVPTKTGYTFLGWSGTDLTDPQKTVSISQGSIGNRSFTANWKANIYTITFDSDGGTVTPESQNVEYKSSFTLPTPEKAGYTFVGWYNDTTLVEAGVYNYASSIVLKAKWEVVNYLITYHLNGGFFYEEAVDKYTVETPTFDIPLPVKEGYTFIGWTGTEINDRQEIISIMSGSIGNKEYTAHWEKMTTQPEGTEDFYYLLNDDGTYTITGYIGSSTSIIIPKYYNGLLINTIAPAAFKDMGNITEVVIGKNITTIGHGAFSGCNAIKSMTIPFTGRSANPSSIVYPFGFIFGETGYYNARETTQYYYNVGSIGTKSPWYDGHKTYYIPKSLNTVVLLQDKLHLGAFFGCRDLMTIRLSEKLKVIEDSAFSCTGLTNITIPASVETIKDNAFYSCSGLKTLTIPKNVKTIGYDAFYECRSIEYLYYNAEYCENFNVAPYGGYNNHYSHPFMFMGRDTAGVKLVIGKDVKVIPDWFFFLRTDISSPNLYISNLEFEEGSTCEKIGKFAFAYSSKLVQIVIPETVVYIGASAFADCENLLWVTFKDLTTWYREEVSILNNLIDVSSREKNAEYLSYKYSSYDWYKI